MSTSFYRIVHPPILDAKKLRIPGNFVRKFGYELGDVATLTVPNGYVWQVGLTKDGKNNIWFGNGWHEFVGYHSIGAGHFLLFKYEKDSNFQVLIFDMSACEIDYPCKDEVTQNEPQNLVNHDEMENDNFVEIVDLTTPSTHFSSLENRTSPSMQNLGVSSSKRTQNCAATLESSKCKHRYEMQSKKCKEEQLEIHESHYVKESRRGKLNICEKNEFFVSLEDMGISISESYRRFTLEERQRALNAAILLKPKNPSFLVMVKESDIRRSFVYVPIKFARKYLSGVECIIVLDSDEKELPIQFEWSQHRNILTRWARVCYEKNLVAGDICVFEMVQLEMKNAFLKVSIFQAK